MPTTTPPAALSGLPLSVADMRGLARLGFDASLGVTDLVEQMHRTVGKRAAPLGAVVTGRTRGVTGWVYGAVRGTTRLAARRLTVRRPVPPARRTSDLPGT
ncbi:MAG: hypothetical protein IAE86_00115 [Burkholderiaceae bacterium]|nr:hypothetical protein [Burkholderiaceae bacterium]